MKWSQICTEKEVGTCRMLGADFDENKYQPSMVWGNLEPLSSGSY